MRVLVLGSGGREHAMVWRLSQDPDVSFIQCAPGNPGMGAGRTQPVSLTAPSAILEMAATQAIDLTIVGPEAALEHGVADVFRAAGRPIVGPGKVASALECSKIYSKQFMTRHKVPTARFQVCDSADAALAALRTGNLGWPLVVKADGLAAGKGVVIAANRPEAEAAVRAMMLDRQFGSAGSRVVLEECLTGPEVSFFVLCDGERAVPLGSAQDHKRIGDGDRGPNTGGMGAFAESPLMTPMLREDVMRRVVTPVLEGMCAEGHPYHGFLYVSLMLTDDGPKVIEFNVRFGDPEAQVLMPLLEGGLARTLLDSATGTLRSDTLAVSADRTVGVVLASRGYPGAVETGQVIHGLDEAATVDGATVFHAGTQVAEGQFVTAGGRVLTVVGRGATYGEAMRTAYRAVSHISFDGMQYRKDIGKKAITSEVVVQPPR